MDGSVACQQFSMNHYNVHCINEKLPCKQLNQLSNKWESINIWQTIGMFWKSDVSKSSILGTPN